MGLLCAFVHEMTYREGGIMTFDLIYKNPSVFLRKRPFEVRAGGAVNHRSLTMFSSHHGSLDVQTRPSFSCLAVELFHQLSQALEVLTDAAAKVKPINKKHLVCMEADPNMHIYTLW